MTAVPPPSHDDGPRAWPIVHTVVRAVLGAALVVFLVLIGLRLAATGSPTAAPTSAESSPPASASPSPTPSDAPSPTPSETTDVSDGGGNGGGNGGGGGGGGGTGGENGGGGGTTQTGPVITSYNAPGSVACPSPPEAPDPNAPTVEDPTVSLSWTSTGADEAWFGINTADAQREPYSAVGTNDSIAISFPCPVGNQTYTITVVGGGKSVSQSIRVTNVGYTG
jgi:hypothetical protein